MTLRYTASYSSYGSLSLSVPLRLPHHRIVLAQFPWLVCEGVRLAGQSTHLTQVNNVLG